jgi:hypothetical protein
VDTAAHLSSEHDILDDVDEESGLYNSIEIWETKKVDWNM